jgi:putative phosphoesterase
LKIGLLSDTHGFLDPALFNHFDSCDEIWHAGDFGTLEVADRLSAFKPLRGVYGNIDGGKLRLQFPENLQFECEESSILISHIGGKPPGYNRHINHIFSVSKPDIFICGHSHILRVIYDKENQVLYLNPGAAGRQGLHKVRTAIRFELQNGKPRNMEVIELGKRA